MRQTKCALKLVPGDRVASLTGGAEVMSTKDRGARSGRMFVMLREIKTGKVRLADWGRYSSIHMIPCKDQVDLAVDSAEEDHDHVD